MRKGKIINMSDSYDLKQLTTKQLRDYSISLDYFIYKALKKVYFGLSVDEEYTPGDIIGSAIQKSENIFNELKFRGEYCEASHHIITPPRIDIERYHNE